jgi:hypothetical protein
MMNISDYKGYNYLLVARDDFLGWAEVKPIKTLISAKVTKFIYNKIIYRHGIFGKLKVNGGLKFKKKVIMELKKLGITRIMIFVYNTRVNDMVERGY